MLNFNSALISFYLQLLVPAALMFFSMPKRRHFALRVSLCVFITVVISILYSSSDLLGIEDAFISHLIYYLTAYLFCYLCVFVCFRLPVVVSMYYLGEAFILQNFCYHLFQLIMRSARVPVGEEYSTFFYLLYQLIIYFVVYLLFFFVVEKQHLRDVREIPRVSLLMELFFFGIDMVVGVYVRHVSGFLSSDDISGILYEVFSVAIAFLLMSLFLGFFSIGRLQENKHQLEKRIEYESRYYEMTRSNIEEMRMLRHDMKHQIAAMKSIENQEERDKALTELESTINRYGTIIKTGNTALDAVLTEKAKYCNAKGISLRVIADGRLLDSMKYGDIYVLFANIVDNAIEGSQREENTSNKDINVKVIKRGGMVFIHEDNWCRSDLVFENEVPKTTKLDPGHGYGIQSISFLVSKYDGTISLKAKDNLFALDIVLPVLTA